MKDPHLSSRPFWHGIDHLVFYLIELPHQPLFGGKPVAVTEKIVLLFEEEGPYLYEISFPVPVHQLADDPGYPHSGGRLRHLCVPWLG